MTSDQSDTQPERKKMARGDGVLLIVCLTVVGVLTGCGLIGFPQMIANISDASGQPEADVWSGVLKLVVPAFIGMFIGSLIFLGRR